MHKNMLNLILFFASIHNSQFGDDIDIPAEWILVHIQTIFENNELEKEEDDAKWEVLDS